MRNRRYQLTAAIAIVLMAIVGCSERELPVSAPSDNIRPPAFTSIPSGPSSLVLAGYSLEFDGRQFDGSQTTFSYTVSDAGAAHALSNFSLQLPDCAPPLLSASPSGGIVGINPLTGLYSIKWDGGLPAGGTGSYSITFAGDVPEGIIWAAVKASADPELGVVAGPCGGFEISGTVYADADENGSRSVDELGIDNVTVALVDANGGIETCTTDASGAFSFLRMDGDFTIRIDSATAALDFNEELFESFDPTGPISWTVTVGPDSRDNDFGFDPQSQEIINELETGVLITNGEPIKFWKRELRSAIGGGKGKSEFDPAAMMAFVTEIHGLFLADPFQFTLGPGIDPRLALREALDILNDKSKDDLAVLRRELLTAEFNHVSGKGIVGEVELQAVLIAWAESVAAQASGASAPAAVAARPDGPARAAGTSVREAGDLMRTINNENPATGGGGGGEG